MDAKLNEQYFVLSYENIGGGQGTSPPSTHHPLRAYPGVQDVLHPARETRYNRRG